MALFPRATAEALVAIELPGAVLLQTPAGAPRAELDRLAAAVLADADGSTPVTEMALRLGVAADAVWAALDRLADAGLLEQRLAPPVASAGWVGRRLAVLGALAAAPATAQQLGTDALRGGAEQTIKAPPQRGAEEDEKRSSEARNKSVGAANAQEQAQKRSNEEMMKQQSRGAEETQKRSAEATQKAGAGPQQAAEQAQKRSSEGGAKVTLPDPTRPAGQR